MDNRKSLRVKTIPVVIPAAGLGKRMIPLTGGKPKELLPFRKMSLIGHAVKESFLSGLEPVYVVIRPEKKEIVTVLEKERSRIESETGKRGTIIYLDQGRARGLGQAIRLFRQTCQTDVFAVILPDNVWVWGPPPITQMVDVFLERATSIIGLIKVGRREASLFPDVGRVTLRKIGNRVDRIENVSPKGGGLLKISRKRAILRGFPRQIFNGDFDRYYDLLEPLLKANKEIDDVPIMQKMASDGRLLGYHLEGMGYDAGMVEGYRQLIDRFESGG